MMYSSDIKQRRKSSRRCICFFFMTVLMGLTTYSSFALNAQIMKYYRYVFAQGTIVLNALALVLLVALRRIPWSQLKQNVCGLVLLFVKICVNYYDQSMAFVFFDFADQCRWACSSVVRKQPTGLQRIGKSRSKVASRMFSPNSRSMNQSQTPLLDDTGSLEEHQLKVSMLREESLVHSSRHWFELGTKRGGFVLRADIQFLIALISCISTFLLHIGATQLAPSVVIALLPLYSASGFIAEVFYQRLRTSEERRRRSPQASVGADDAQPVEGQHMSASARSVLSALRASSSVPQEDYGWSGFGALLITFSAIMAFIPGVVNPNGASEDHLMWPHDFDMSASIGVWFIIGAAALHGCSQIFRRYQVYKQMRLLSFKDNAALDPKNRPKHYPDALRNEMGITLIESLIGFLLVALAGLMQDTSSQWSAKKIKHPVQEGLSCAVGHNENGDASCNFSPILFLLQLSSGMALSGLYLTLQHRQAIYETLFEHFSLKSAWRARVAEIHTNVAANDSKRKCRKISKGPKDRKRFCHCRCRPGALISIGLPSSLLSGFGLCYALELRYDRFASSPGSGYDSSSDKLGIYFIPFVLISCGALFLMQRKISPNTGKSSAQHTTRLDQLFFNVSNHETRNNFVGSVSGSWFRLAHFANLKWLYGMQLGVQRIWELTGYFHPSSLHRTDTTVPMWKSVMARKIHNGVEPLLRSFGEHESVAPEETLSEAHESEELDRFPDRGQGGLHKNNGAQGTPIPSLQDLPGINMTQSNSSRVDESSPFR